MARFALTLNETIIVSVNQGMKKYKLKGVIYYNAAHFTCRYIVKRGMIWFHDGLAPQSQKLTRDGSMLSMSSNLHTRGSMGASLAIYMLA